MHIGAAASWVIAQLDLIVWFFPALRNLPCYTERQAWRCQLAYGTLTTQHRSKGEGSRQKAVQGDG